VKEQDNNKRATATEHGITLIEIPYWWDGSTPSVQATIQDHRPELFPNASKGTSIPAWTEQTLSGLIQRNPMFADVERFQWTG
jgi:hypothetical protein